MRVEFHLGERSSVQYMRTLPARGDEVQVDDWPPAIVRHVRWLVVGHVQMVRMILR